ncbi:fatty acid desaturase [Roseibium sp. CAU 1637]|uniref:Fatty acid desaturase n=1 Tax=Roseibium limicola TaxID=2816037 RepID=A0A939JA30_9HYPH|nr:fatty acid desaturase [Roseibium limicola]MBO0347001.1 fatty acid desaturase [Roseibium limicola]
MLKHQIQELAAHCERYRTPVTWRACSQIVTTVLPFLALFAAMYFSLDISYWLTLGLAIPAGGLLVRFFIIQHDCGHGSFFPSQIANDMTGRIVSILTLTPYAYWRRAHALHHASSANLDRRGIGDITTLTVAEYSALPFLKRVGYRVYRNPFFLTLVGGVLHFLVIQRVPFSVQRPNRQMTLSVLALNLAIVLVYGILVYLLGWTDFLMLFAPMVLIACAAGVWLFYIQHQFEETHWSAGTEWDRKTAAILGSSYYALPKVLHWFTGNIGLHHIHHLCSQIPNYRLQECMAARPELAHINRLTIWESLKCANLALWDESTKRLVPFRAA